ncbi:translation initiation factor 2 [Lysinibacillus agricola]
MIGAAISTLGDASSTIAAGLALEEQQNDSQNNSNDIERLQKQIDELSNKKRQIKKR